MTRDPRTVACNEALPLAGRSLAVTRPLEQADSLCLRIEAAGGRAIRFPVLAIGPAPDAAQLEAIVPRLDEFDLAFFVSPNAIQHALGFVLARRTWPAGLRVATVGKGSEQVLVQRGFVDAVVPDDGFDSESVLALPEFAAEAVRGRKVVIFRGDGGRNLIRDTLRERGAWVEYVTCYQRFCPQPDPALLLQPAAQGKLDGLLLTSSEGVRNLALILGAEGVHALREVPVFASHARIAAQARDAGFIEVTGTAAGDDGLLQALTGYFG
ncbi:uroporphyrinogen-III synthase [Thauera linaloolentis]|uniref:Uroporphyrinogen-III synthase n=1 Tax=Thauera linaloolentis (strain DSM 12138 / JCM 21573 / CCUG 41526 / CIP 105981 / IAM 15112 / NBRC 102519 / 47Lol) TaxID=1123367 RepID=N6ZDY6_THAL4|nr:uroporphyrinogen-III synthase [Thauera linaloolentis]ENO90354.1 uroporphyrinogen III synthase HEM4 [Thauera linaloolentis 47Lol = DSM 12138]MCM8564072.1 uroporphyrinogen-III synthase [Thauera linaloolentis]